VPERFGPITTFPPLRTVFNSRPPSLGSLLLDNLYHSIDIHLSHFLLETSLAISASGTIDCWLSVAPQTGVSPHGVDKHTTRQPISKALAVHWHILEIMEACVMCAIPVAKATRKTAFGA
jgi:hypothetical protein